VSAEQQTSMWVAMALSLVRKSLGYSRQEFSRFAVEHGLIPFLYDNYELLHYYGNDSIVADAMRYLREDRGYADAAS